MLDLQEHLQVDGLPDCQPLCRGHAALPGHLTPQASPWLPVSAFGISYLGVEVCFGCRPGNC